MMLTHVFIYQRKQRCQSWECHKKWWQRANQRTEKKNISSKDRGHPSLEPFSLFSLFLKNLALLNSDQLPQPAV